MSLKDEFKQELERIGSDMRALGNSIKAKAKQANHSVKAAWADVEPKIAKFETESGVATDKAVAALKKSGSELISQLKGLKERLSADDGDAEQGEASEPDGDSDGDDEGGDADPVEPAPS